MRFSTKVGGTQRLGQDKAPGSVSVLSDQKKDDSVCEANRPFKGSSFDLEKLAMKKGYGHAKEQGLKYLKDVDNDHLEDTKTCQDTVQENWNLDEMEDCNGLMKDLRGSNVIEDVLREELEPFCEDEKMLPVCVISSTRDFMEDSVS